MAKTTLTITVLALPGLALAQTDVGNPEDMPEPPKIFSPYVERTAADSNLAEGVYWGDTHLHTSYSTDAGMFGNTLGPEEVLTSHGLRARLIRLLDFLVVADHAENLGLAPFIAESNPELLYRCQVRRFRRSCGSLHSRGIPDAKTAANHHRRRAVSRV